MSARTRMKRVVLTALAVLGYVLLLPLWVRLRQKFRGREYRVLTYHSVSSTRRNETNVSPAEFRRHVRCLAASANLAGLAEAAAGAPGGTLPGGRLVCLTLDDGYADNLQEACPILREYDIPATCFLSAAYPGTGECLPHDAGQPREAVRVLAWDEIRELAGKGVRIGSHGEEHRRFSGMDEDGTREALRRSKERIEAATGNTVHAFAFPYGRAGDFTQRHVDGAREAGYRLVASAMYGWNRVGATDTLLRRIGIDSSDSLFTLKAKINGALDLLRVLETRVARRIIGLLNGT